MCRFNRLYVKCSCCLFKIQHLSGAASCLLCQSQLHIGTFNYMLRKGVDSLGTLRTSLWVVVVSSLVTCTLLEYSNGSYCFLGHPKHLTERSCRLPHLRHTEPHTEDNCCPCKPCCCPSLSGCRLDTQFLHQHL